MPASASPPPAAAAGPQDEVIETGTAADLSTALLEVIAEKTGYPVEMLELEMALDTDLGIDSIKRVEILSALQQRLPDAPAVKPEDLGVLQTIGQIVEHLAGGRHKPGALPPAAATPVTRIARDTVATTLLDVVAAKTGYPVAMLELEMALDTDLGIDSIKRVEILSALQEQLPGVPAIKPEHLGTLQTLGQIVDFLASVSGTPESAAAPEAAASSQTAASIERQVLKVVPLQAKTVRDRLQPAAGAEIWVTADGGELSAQLCRELEARQLVPRQAAIEELLASEPSPQLSGLIIVAPRQGTGDRFLQQAFQLLQRVEPALTAAAETGASPFLATLSRLNGCFGLTPGAPLHDPLSGGLAGLCKTAGHEWPGIHCKALDLANDLADTEQTAHRVVDEILTRGPVEIGLTAQGLYSLKLTSQSVPAERRQMPLAAGELVVISGGARGVTAEVAVALAKAGQATLLLLGRSPEATAEPDWLTGLTAENEIKKALIAHAQSPLKPKDVARRYRELSSNREILKNIGRIEAAGGTAVYRSVDLRDAAAVAAVIAEARRQFGPVKGLIHGAGVLADRLIKDKTLEQFDAVYQTKIAGLRALLAAVEADPLNFMALFSSSTGRFGRTGQIDYAVANEILNKLAQQQATARPACRVVSLNWGPWDGGMVTAALKQVFEQEGIRVIDLKAGAQYLIQEISTPPGGPVELVILGADQQEASEEPVQQQNIYVSRAFDLDLSIEQYPFLKSHVLDGRAVLPLAVIVEWLAHAAIHNNPGLRFHGFNDLRVLKGVILEAGQVHNLQLMTGKAIKSDGVHVVPVELSGTAADGRQHVHARAKIVLAGRLPAAKAAAERLELPDYARPIEEIYRPERLFHGPDFHGIREVLGCSDAGISCLVRPAPAPQQWITQPLRNAWLSDPLALDCSFQLLILWSFERHNAGSLPVFAGRYRQYQEHFPEHGAEIRVRLLEQSSSKATAEIDFIDPVSGSLIARIEDYQCVIDASLNASFQRNKLQGVA
jgi:NAD(P)-dependent dehydrogenase (short-subunit alcohol dehydrogenase family)/acyl carrier protein